MKPKVTVVLSCYNQRAYVRQAVDSVLKQTYPNVELVATDNGSTDGTQALLKEYAGDPRVRLLLRAENGNLNTLANQATNMAAGEFIALLHGDDYYLPEKIEKQLELFSTLPRDYGAVYGPSYRLNETTGERWRDRALTDSGFILDDMLLKFHSVGAINILAPLLRKECFVRYPFREEFFMEGESIFFRIAMSYRFQYLDEPLTVMRDHMANMGKAIRANRDWVVRLFERLGEERDFPRESLPALRRFLGRHLRDYGWQGVRFVGDRQWARECYLMALKRDPAQMLHPRTLAGLGLLALPESAAAALNRFAAGLRRYRVNAVYKDGYS